MRHFLLFLLLLSTTVIAQNKYSYKDVLDFKTGILNSSERIGKTVPIRINEYQTLLAVGVQSNLVTYKYEVDGWNDNSMMSDNDIKQSKILAIKNMMRSQQYPDMFLECLRRTKLEFQIMYFAKSRKYIGGFRLGYKDFLNNK
jgi:hypothetical protein